MVGRWFHPGHECSQRVSERYVSFIDRSGCLLYTMYVLENQSEMANVLMLC